MTIEQKFGAPPPVFHPAIILAGQMVVSMVILLVIRPPFVCSNGTLNVSTVLFISLGITTGCGFAYIGNASCSDIFKGLFEVVKVCRN
jgi:hypothetical protein